VPQASEAKGKDKAAAAEADPALVRHMVDLHKDAARVGAAPRHFAVLVRLYKALLKLKQEQLQAQRCHLQVGRGPCWLAGTGVLNTTTIGCDLCDPNSHCTPVCRPQACVSVRSAVGAVASSMPWAGRLCMLVAAATLALLWQPTTQHA
jgi:hypothetical protein